MEGLEKIIDFREANEEEIEFATQHSQVSRRLSDRGYRLFLDNRLSEHTTYVWFNDKTNTSFLDYGRSLVDIPANLLTRVKPYLALEPNEQLQDEPLLNVLNDLSTLSKHLKKNIALYQYRAHLANGKHNETLEIPKIDESGSTLEFQNKDILNDFLQLSAQAGRSYGMLQACLMKPSEFPKAAGEMLKVYEEIAKKYNGDLKQIAQLPFPSRA